jgi:hypothetical protein
MMRWIEFTDLMCYDLRWSFSEKVWAGLIPPVAFNPIEEGVLEDNLAVAQLAALLLGSGTKRLEEVP